ncbi:hypothetical protein ACVXG8_26750 [Escherichia coli]
MLANTCTPGPIAVMSAVITVRRSRMNMIADVRYHDKCSKCLSGCKFRNNVGNFGGFLSLTNFSQSIP